MKWLPPGVGQGKTPGGSRVEFDLKTWPDLMAIDGGGPWTLTERASDEGDGDGP